MLRAGAAMCLLAGALAAGCAGSRPPPRLFAVADVYYPRGDFEGAALVRVDSRTLQPLHRMLRLGDAITSRVLSPDGHTLAFGGYNDREILFVDRSQPLRVTRSIVVPPNPDGVEIDVEGWPSRSRLIAVATVEGAWWGPHPSQLLIVDPEQRRVLRRTPLHGTVWSSVTVARTTALLVVHGRIPRVVVVNRDGSTWSTRLSRLDLGGRERMRLGGMTFVASRVPAMTTDGRARVFVVAADRPIAEVRPATRTVRYHDVTLPHRYLEQPPPMEPGSGGVHLTYAVWATWFGDEQLGVGGGDELPGWVAGVGVGHSEPPRIVELVDTRSWRLVQTVRATECEQTRSVTLCHADVGGYAPDGKGSRGPSLVAFDRCWRRLYERRNLWWDVTDGRLFAGAADGSRISELDPATGRKLRQITPSPLRNQMWPLDLFTWGGRR